MGFDLGILVWAAGIMAVLTVVMRWVFAPSRPRTGRPDSGPQADLGLLTAGAVAGAPGPGAGGEEPAVRARPALLGLPAGPRQLRPAGLRPGRGTAPARCWTAPPPGAGTRSHGGPSPSPGWTTATSSGRPPRPAPARSGWSRAWATWCAIPTACCSSTPGWAPTPRSTSGTGPAAPASLRRWPGRASRSATSTWSPTATCTSTTAAATGSSTARRSTCSPWSSPPPAPSRTTRCPR